MVELFLILPGTRCFKNSQITYLAGKRIWYQVHSLDNTLRATAQIHPKY
jgi:hypothetical protein